MGSSLGFHIKLSVVTIAIVLITVVILSMSHIFMTRQEYLRQGREVLTNVSETLEDSVSLQHTLMQRKLHADRDIMRTHFELRGFPIPEVLMDVEMRLVDQETGAQSTETLPGLKHGATYLHEDSSVVRRISELTGGVVSVLQVHNGRMVRVSTSLETPLPQWGQGSYISKSTPVHADIMQGKATEALLWMGGMWRLAAYAPIKDLNGTVLGALEVAHPLISDAFAEFVRGVRVGGYGGSFAFDAKGRTLTGPDSSHTKIDHALMSRMSTARNATETARLLSVEMDDGKHIEVALHSFAPWQVTFVTWVGSEELMAGVTSRLVRSSALSVIVPLVLSVVLTGIACKILLAPVRAMAVLANDVANGNYTRTITYPAHDSIGHLATALNTMVSSTKDMLTGIAGAAHSLSGASQELDTASGSLTRSSSKTAEMSHAVHDLAKSVSANMRSISSAMEEAAMNVHSVAGAAEELSATITEVTHSTERARLTTADAVRKAGGTTAHVRELENSAREISAVSASISAISAQTNLLALNATIEAARAGDAGKGFAVVANEIKELSRQTAAATEDIKDRITAIQSLTAVTTQEIGEIIGVVEEMHDIVAMIATAVDEQAAMTREIADNVGHASQSIAEISSNVTSSSTMTQGINDAVERALDTSQSMHARSELVHAKSADLGNLSGQLQRLVERFQC